MKLDELVFVGLNGYVAALNRDTGEIYWSQGGLHKGYVTLLLDGDRLMVLSNGYMYCLNALTGHIHWQNPMRGYGHGVGSLISVRGAGNQAQLLEAAHDMAGKGAAASATMLRASSG